MLLDRADATPISGLGMRGAIHDIQGVNGCTSLRVNSRERDQKVFAVQARQDIVKQAQPVWGLDLNKRINRMRIGIDDNPRRKFNSRRKTMALALRSFD